MWSDLGVRGVWQLKLRSSVETLKYGKLAEEVLEKFVRGKSIGAVHFWSQEGLLEVALFALVGVAFGSGRVQMMSSLGQARFSAGVVPVRLLVFLWDMVEYI